jgi:hypothetical protein
MGPMGTTSNLFGEVERPAVSSDCSDAMSACLNNGGYQRKIKKGVVVIPCPIHYFGVSLFPPLLLSSQHS